MTAIAEPPLQTEPGTPMETVADLVQRLGSIPVDRILIQPPPGQATEQDLVEFLARDEGLCELVDGVLVLKEMGYYESRLAVVLISLLEPFVAAKGLGFTLGPDATLGLRRGRVRLPDVSYFAWRRFPNRELPRVKVLAMAPDLAVEIFSERNTPAEMERKLREYFAAGVRLVWYVDPPARTVRVYTSADESRLLTEEDALDGGDVIPGFALLIAEWFQRAGSLAAADAE
jgi:Uma2 family endonuclease